MRLTTQHPDPTSTERMFSRVCEERFFEVWAQGILSNTSAHQEFSLSSTGIEQPFCLLKAHCQPEGKPPKSGGQRWQKASDTKIQAVDCKG